MYGLTKLALAAASLVAPLVGATSSSPELVERQASTWWLADPSLKHGIVPSNPSYTVFRNVQTYGAKGDGVTDDSAAINKAISDGGRCGQGCNSTTTTPALVYFPPGTYLVKQPIIQYYFTQLVGDAVTKPTIKADPSLKAMGMIDSDPYDDQGNSWWTNQNNFYRQVRNFKLDIRGADPTLAAVHWQVAQAASLTNIDFLMDKGSQQKGIFMDNGSGGFMSDLTFSGGLYGAFFGNQQFTTRNLKCTNTDTCIFMNWNWLWTLKSLNVDSSNRVGINASGLPNVGSVIVQDSKIAASQFGIVTAFESSNKQSNGTLVIDNVDFTGTPAAIVDVSGAPVPGAPSGNTASWIQGSAYTTGATNGAASSASASGQQWIQKPLNAATKPASLLNNGIVAEVTKPQYETATKVVNVMTSGAKGDGVNDDTAAIQAVLDAATPDTPVFFPQGHYLLKDTLKINKDVNIVGEVWPVLMADAASFGDDSSPKVVIQVGQAGSKINVQMSDLVISTNGPAKGAILMEWNTAGNGSPGSTGLWDVHWRIGGYSGSNMDSDKCARAAALAPQPLTEACYGSFLMFHMTAASSGYFENVWWWVADHSLDGDGQQTQINIFQGRGVLIESQGPAWFYGTASEHSQLYNYQLNQAKNIYLGAVQTETAYMQGGNGILATDAFKGTNFTADPDFSECASNPSSKTCSMTWGVRVLDSSDVLVYGAGLYSFFNDYDEHCLKSGGGSDNCQDNMVYVDDCSTDITLYGLSTKAAVNMVTFSGSNEGILAEQNPSTFCETAAVVEIA